MWREETLEELSDGRLYTSGDMVKLGTNGCRGCSDCCKMGPVIVLDPLDVFELNRFLRQSFEELLNETIELKVIDDLILPVLKLVAADPARHQKETSGSGSVNLPVAGQSNPARHQKETSGPGSVNLPVTGQSNPVQRQSEIPLTQDEPMVCPYLGDDGRCRIHAFRPGICRLYPLGRSWEGDDFHYILQINECTHMTGTKIKVKKWLQIPDLGSYEQFCRDWHSLLSASRRLLEGTASDGSLRRQICVYLLRQFYLCDWNVDDFYAVFAQRRAEALRHLGFAA